MRKLKHKNCLLENRLIIDQNKPTQVAIVSPPLFKTVRLLRESIFRNNTFNNSTKSYHNSEHLHWLWGHLSSVSIANATTFRLANCTDESLVRASEAFEQVNPKANTEFYRQHIRIQYRECPQRTIRAQRLRAWYSTRSSGSRLKMSLRILHQNGRQCFDIGNNSKTKIFE